MKSILGMRFIETLDLQKSEGEFNGVVGRKMAIHYHGYGPLTDKSFTEFVEVSKYFEFGELIRIQQEMLKPINPEDLRIPIGFLIAYKVFTHSDTVETINKMKGIIDQEAEYFFKQEKDFLLQDMIPILKEKNFTVIRSQDIILPNPEEKDNQKNK